MEKFVDQLSFEKTIILCSCYTEPKVAATDGESRAPSSTPIRISLGTEVVQRRRRKCPLSHLGEEEEEGCKSHDSRLSSPSLPKRYHKKGQEKRGVRERPQ